jgi:translocation and assembly module TamB
MESSHRWLTNDIEVTAHFDRVGLLPDEATVKADSFSIPAQRLNFPQYEDLNGSASLIWRDRRFALNITAAARPGKQRGLPPLKLELRAQGDRNLAQIETVRLSAPWLELELADPVRVQFTTPYLLDATALKIFADLSQQTWLPAEGQLDGRASFQPGTGKFPAVSFALSGSGIALSNLQTRMLNLSGAFLWPWLAVTNARVEFADGAVAQASGKLQVSEQVVRDGRLHFQGWLGRDWLPSGYSYEDAIVEASFEGPLATLSHQGQIKIDEFASPSLKTLRLESQWQGQRLHFRQSKIHITADKSALDFEGAIDADRPELSFHATTLTLHKEGQPVLALASPFGIWIQQINPPGTNSTPSLVLKMEPLLWIGAGHEIHLEGDLAWPQRGRLNSSIKAIEPTLFEDFINLPLPHVALQQMELAAAWTNGPVDVHLKLMAETEASQGLPVAVNLNLDGTHEGLLLEKLAIFSQTQLVAEAKGFLPMTLRPSVTTNPIEFRETQPLKLEVMTQPTAFFWDDLAKWSGLRLHKPDLKMNVSGTWGSPQGQILLQAERIEFPGAKRPLPSVDKLELALGLDASTAHVTNFQFFVEKQRVSLTGTMPLGKRFWQLGRTAPRPDWQNVTARLQIKHAQLAPFAFLLPDALSAQGELDADIALLPGVKLEGELTLAGLRTRPLEAVGPIADITGRLKFAGRSARLETFTAAIAGQPVTAEGSFELPIQNWPKGDSLPPFELKLRGANIPLARTPELILRADLNVALTHAAGTTPLMAGAVHLRDGYFLSDLNDLVPGKVAAPSRRPPYFSFEEEPFASWRLNLAVQGQEFLKVRSPLFRGNVSANLTLSGTLKDPLALGELKIDSGAVTFPFANLQVNQGLVTLTSENPYRPQLFLTAKTRRIGYDIQMEITGPADEPVVQFSSSPPLSSEQILLMLTAGEMPRDVTRLSTEQRTQRLAMFVGKSVLSQLGIGDAGEDRLTIRSGEEVTEQGKLTYDVEYKLSKKWSLIGQYDRFSEYNAGIKWRIYSK